MDAGARRSHHAAYHRRRGGAYVGLLLLLLPLFSPAFFVPSGVAAPASSVFSEWNSPKPRHLTLMKGAVQRQSLDGQQAELWSPLANQGWKSCPTR